MINTREDKHNGVTYKKIESNIPIEGAMAFSDKKFVLRGKPAIEIMDNSYKFGDQVQVTVFNNSGSVTETQRVGYAGKYDRMELFFNKEEFKEMCKEFLKNE